MLRRLRAFGWSGPYQRGKHPFMAKDNARLTIPNPHYGDIDWSLMKSILRSAEISPHDWDQA
jgi:predicted RNA binding protein YcfA (HicA-like mRNA interferase family)